MRCKYCGGDIRLEDAYCSYCGKPNEHAARHAGEMAEFRADYARSKSRVEHTVRRFTGSSVRAVIIALLLIAIVLLLLLGGRAYSIRRAVIQARSERSAAACMAEMDALLAGEDFLGFSAYCEANYIDPYDNAFEPYAPAERAARSFSYLYTDILRAANPPEYYDTERLISTLTDDLGYFYSALDMEQYEYYEGADSEQNRAALAAMEERAALLLQSFCGLTAEEAAQMRYLSEARRAIALEEGLSHAE